MNAPPSQQVERRGANGSSNEPSSLLFFGGIVVAIALLGAGALAIWGPEKDVSSKQIKLATDPPPPDVMPSFPPEPVPAVSETVAPPTELPADPAPADSATKKTKKKGGKGVRKK